VQTFVYSDILEDTKVNGGDTMTKQTKSFRFAPMDIKKLDIVHDYYKGNYEARVSVSNMDNLHKWTQAQTLAVCIRDRYEELLAKGVVEQVED
jgi:hypothetical protein